MKVENYAIDRMGDHFVVVRLKDGSRASVKYDDEKHCLRNIRMIVRFRGGWEQLEVRRLWEEREAKNVQAAPDEKPQDTLGTPEAPLYVSDKPPKPKKVRRKKEKVAV